MSILEERALSVLRKIGAIFSGVQSKPGKRGRCRSGKYRPRRIPKAEDVVATLLYFEKGILAKEHEEDPRTLTALFTFARSTGIKPADKIPAAIWCPDREANGVKGANPC